MKRQEKLTNFFSTEPGTVAEGDLQTSSTQQDGAESPPIIETLDECDSNASPAVKKPRLAFDPMDIGRFVRKSSSLHAPLTEEERFKALTDCWKPDEHYQFPKVLESTRTRAFQHHYLVKWPWLAYSEMHGGGAFCKYCVLFARETSDQRGPNFLGVLVAKPLNKYKKALDILKNHERCQYHCEAKGKAEKFLDWYNDKVGHDLRNRLLAAREEQVKKNRQGLVPIIRTILLCGKQNIPLRGHRDDGSLSAVDGNNNDGNFRALLRYRLDAGDRLLEEHLNSAKKNATYVSHTFQNEIISTIGKIIRRRIVAEVKVAKFFAVLADESRDVGKTDQLTVCLRYVGGEDNQHVVKEVFLKFSDVEEKTGSGLARSILGVLQEEGLDIRNLRGQGYDGCSAMRGSNKGAQAEIKAVVPQALYFHCASHCLNLALVHSSELAAIRLVAGSVANVCAFFSNSSKRTRILQDQIERSNSSNSRKKRLKTLCMTRWVESHQAFIAFKELLIPIVQSLLELEQEVGETGARSYELLSAICKCQFVTSLFIIESFSSLFLPLSVKLQAKELDIFAALDLVDNVLLVLRRRREAAIDGFQQILAEVTEVCDSLEIDIRMPRICERQLNRENHPADSSEEYFRVTSYIPYLDSLIDGFISLFADARQGALKVQCLIPKFAVRSSVTDLHPAIEFYESDLSCSVNVAKAEFERWRAKWMEVPQNGVPASAIDALNHCPAADFPKINILLRILATYPVTTASAERTFSSLRLLKTYLRSVMGEARLNGLASMSILRGIDVDPEEVIDSLASNARKLDFVL
ncbi:52 kDa repressor of the inhibitor of the protein kinase-like [Galendromus occidentalis]|uniref:52 kDa repressor of the inhibitor of the protein kinase-like n=1 Tax=Galendromus occidentalis TaxID=34638 RepID=A0AAJ6QZ85_9ACAR|nr:52 kDa repressor of the inhibitor of the protein kinase-like [Galendromus occidentalis]